MTGLQVTGLTRSFGSTRVLDRVDLDVPDGITAVLGSSGCGKTTLLRLIAGFLTPDAGRITIGGEVVVEVGRSVPPRARRIGYVPQEGALFPHLDVAANIGFGLPRADRRPARGAARVAEMLALVELADTVAHRYPHELSGGQQQRVALARALAPDPALILLDEPFSSLDAGLREDTGRSVARALRASGATGVLVTHDQGEALSLADQVAVMTNGRFLQVARPDEIYLNPTSSEVASFVGNATLLPAMATDGYADCELGRVSLTSRIDGPVTLAVRPEQVSVTPVPDASADPHDVVVAEIVEVSYFGHDATVRARVLAPGADSLIVIARVPAGGVPTPGTKVGLTVLDRVLAFQGHAR